MEGEQNTSPPLQYHNCFDIFQTFLFILFCPQGEVGYIVHSCCLFTLSGNCDLYYSPFSDNKPIQYTLVPFSSYLATVIYFILRFQKVKLHSTLVLPFHALWQLCFILFSVFRSKTIHSTRQFPFPTIWQQ